MWQKMQTFPEETELASMRSHPAALLYHLALCPLLVGVLTIWFALLRQKSQWLVLTDRRLIGRTAGLAGKRLDVPLNQIDAAAVKAGPFARRFGYGTLELRTKTAVYRFPAMQDPEQFRTVLFDAIRACDRRRSQTVPARRWESFCWTGK